MKEGGCDSVIIPSSLGGFPGVLVPVAVEEAGGQATPTPTDTPSGSFSGGISGVSEACLRRDIKM